LQARLAGTRLAPRVSESALIVRVPEAEAHVERWRARYDPAHAQGVPAHITLLYPFLAPQRITSAALEPVAALAAATAPFDFALARGGRFPGVFFLAPDPAEPFVALTRALQRRFPDHPPYGGAFDTIVPHLTVVHAGEAEQQAAESDLAGIFAPGGGIRSRCDELVLIENSSGRWRTLRVFALGASG
jgi:2'-5' RNA ligase